ncbi:MAG TPA: S8 family peptidase [Candidatus Kapabacteria bacterium]|nr:S8 family peptidase [Candidatus Kapabacteria bacterium]
MMRTIDIRCTLLAAAAMLIVASRARAQEPVAHQHIIVVKVRESGRDPAAAAMAALEPIAGSYGIESAGSWLNPGLLNARPSGLYKSSAAQGGSLGRILTVHYRSNAAPADVARAAALLPGIEYAEPAYVRTLSYVPNDQYLSQQWYLERVGAYTAWDAIRGNSSIIIAITDTGIDPTHPDLKAALWQNQGETGTDGQGRDKRTNGVDDDGNGLVDDWAGYDFGGTDGYTPDNDPTPHYWHGTHVAGIAGATGDNTTGIAGVAYGVQLMSVKISDDEASGDPLVTKGHDGILYSARMGARIINCSWGGPGFSRAEQELIDTVTSWGSLVVAAAGNNGGEINSYPASYRGVLSVSSVVLDDQRSFFSNYNTHVGLTAPGDGIFSTTPLAFGNGNGPYRTASGTSMASPVVAGAAALVALKYPGLTPEEIAAVLRATADNIDSINPAYRYLLGSGRLNLARAIQVGPAAAWASIVSDSIIEERPDGIIEPGEWIEVRASVKNLLRRVTDLRVELDAASGTIPVDTPVESFGVMEQGDVRSSHPGSFRLQVPSPLPLDYKLPLRLIALDNGTEIGTLRVDVMVNPNYATTAFNRTTVTFTGNGRIGFNDFPANEQGLGFRIDTSQNLLAEGGLMIGVSPDRLADVVRAGDQAAQSQGLQVVAPYRVAISAPENAMVGTATFNDAHLTQSQKIGIDVGLRTVQYSAPSIANATFLFYRIRNTSGAPLIGLHCALYLDWDIGVNGAFDRVGSDLSHRMGHAHNTLNNRLPFAGAMLLSNQPMDFNAMDNGAPPLSNGFYQVEKWNSMSNGVQREESNVGDCSMVIGAGPIDLQPGADTLVAFALLAGVNLTELKITADSILARYAALGYIPGGPIMLPEELTLDQATPNPFTGYTDLSFSMPRDGYVSIDVYNTLGQHVAQLTNDHYARGTHVVRFTPGSQPSEVYLVQMHAFDQFISRKLVHIGE